MRELEVAAHLRASPTLTALALGGVYSHSTLGVEGITNPATTTSVWTGGVFQPTLVVRQRQPVPTLQFVDFKQQMTDTNQVVGVWGYALDAATVTAMLDVVYALVQGFPFASAWPARWTETMGPEAAPELPPGVQMMRADYAIRAIRRPVEIEM